MNEPAAIWESGWLIARSSYKNKPGVEDAIVFWKKVGLKGKYMAVTMPEQRVYAETRFKTVFSRKYR